MLLEADYLDPESGLVYDRIVCATHPKVRNT
mgnify:FL=1